MSARESVEEGRRIVESGKHAPPPGEYPGHYEDQDHQDHDQADHHNGNAYDDRHRDDPGPQEPPDGSGAEYNANGDGTAEKQQQCAERDRHRREPGTAGSRSGRVPPMPGADQHKPPVPGSLQHKGEPGTAEPESLPLYADVAALLDGTMPEPPQPVLLIRTDGQALFYLGQVNLLFGDAETGKTFVALAGCAEALRAGRRVLVLDLDHNGVEATVSRLLMMGAPRGKLRDPNVFRYCEPQDRDDVRQVVKDSMAWRPAVAVVDSIGELMPMLGANSNSANEFTHTHTAVLKPLALSGAAVIAVDHLAKNPDSRAHGPGGSAAKPPRGERGVAAGESEAAVCARQGRIGAAGGEQGPARRTAPALSCG